jgi:1,4-alpha-glucan branching enzyme
MLSQQDISTTTPTGAMLPADGATFRGWAPRATAVYPNGSFAGTVYDQQTEDRLLSKDAVGYWTGFQPGAQDGDQYRFWVVGPESSEYKRDPYARELAPSGFPNRFSILRASGAYPWHDAGFSTPDFSDMVIYQAHIGTYAIRNVGVGSNFLDVASKIPYLAALGINLLQPLPIDEQEATPSMGYGGADLFICCLALTGASRSTWAGAGDAIASTRGLCADEAAAGGVSGQSCLKISGFYSRQRCKH